MDLEELKKSESHGSLNQSSSHNVESSDAKEMTGHIGESGNDEMIFSMSDDVVPIFWLPDELLRKIYSYMTNIPNKLKLEQVSKRFRFVSCQSLSWKGIHKLEFIIKSSDSDENDSDGPAGVLNGYSVPFAKWPAVVRLLFDRIQISQLMIRCGSGKSFFDSNPTVLSDLMELFTRKTDKMNIEHLEFTYIGKNSTHNDQFQLLFHSLQLALPNLKSLYLRMDHLSTGISLAPVWPLVEKCDHLKEIHCSYNLNGVDFCTPLIGKPLTMVVLGQSLFYSVIDNAISIINGASGDGVHYINLTDTCRSWPYSVDIDLKEFCNCLTEKARMKLKSLRVDYIFDTIYKQFHLIQSMLPNLKSLETASAGVIENDNGMKELLTNIVSFLTLCCAESFPREINIQQLSLSDIETFKSDLKTECEVAEIDVQFRESDADDNESQSVKLSKGNAFVEIGKFYEKSNDPDPDVEDHDLDNDLDVGEFYVEDYDDDDDIENE